MKVMLESTSEIVRLNDIECRVWEGHTESGIAVQAMIPRIAVRIDADCSQFKAELREQPPPRMAMTERAFPLRMIL